MEQFYITLTFLVLWFLRTLSIILTGAIALFSVGWLNTKPKPKLTISFNKAEMFYSAFYVLSILSWFI